MKQKTKDILLTLIITIGLIVGMLLNIQFNMNYLVVVVMLIVIGGVWIIYMYNYPYCDKITHCNKTLVNFSQITKIVLLIGTTVEHRFGAFSGMAVSEEQMFRVHYIILIIIFVIECICFFRKVNSKRIRILVMINYMYLYIMFSITINTFWILVIGIIFLCCYTVYGDKKSIYIITIGANVGNVIAVIKHIIANNYLNDKHMISEYVIEILIMTVFTLLLINSSDIVRKMNNTRLMMAKQEEEKANKLAQQIMSMGIKVKNDVDSTNLVINELDNAMNTTARMLEHIVEKNYNNEISVKEQKDISNKIAKMTQEVMDEVSKTIKVVNNSLKEVESVKNSLDVIKTMSNNIVKDNKQVISVIDNFVENTKDVRKTTMEIEDISEQTNLVSLNATIKSIKAGNLGKGFEVVANEVYKLAQEVTILTHSINEIVNDLGENALTAQQMVNEVVTAVNEENISIDYTADEFNYVQENILYLKNNINDILYKTKQMSVYNKEIEDNIMGLTCSTQEINEKISDVVEINNENNKNTTNIEGILKGLGDITEKLDKLTLKNTTSFIEN